MPAAGRHHLLLAVSLDGLGVSGQLQDHDLSSELGSRGEHDLLRFPAAVVGCAACGEDI